ncbi:hypothetical protein LPJ78_001421 [Coemansia sp. RSA 989]|nr:hypothetical protein LPJ78_001421 [Coemansia sp. RSA 989]
MVMRGEFDPVEFDVVPQPPTVEAKRELNPGDDDLKSWIGHKFDIVSIDEIEDAEGWKDVTSKIIDKHLDFVECMKIEIEGMPYQTDDETDY